MLLTCRWAGWRRMTYSGGSVWAVGSWCRQLSGRGRAREEGGRPDPRLTHNIGIMAHIDAGKTTTTERMLYCAGLTSRVGNVDSGSTVMDYLPPERERGITISSAAISLGWAGRTLNLVDTPGHADFTFEVERSLRVLDGAIALLDGSAGVEAQTLAVWRQARRCCVPCIAFVNKMDNPRACLPTAAESMRTRLGVQPLLTQLPLGRGRSMTGVVDLIQGHALLWPEGGDGTAFSRVPLEELPQDVQADACRHKEQLVEQVAMLDDTLAALVLENECDAGTLDPADLTTAIRRACLAGTGLPVLCGSALRGVGIQPLMEAVSAYLPPASDAALRVPAVARGLCAYAFKQTYDAHRGLLVYLRLYAGSLQPNSPVYNASRSTREKVTRILLAQADEVQEVGGAYEGNIAVVMGLKHTQTGDTLVQSAAVGKALWEEEGVASLLAPPTIAPPVFFCTVEPISAANQRSLEHALQCLAQEDPSLRVSVDQDTGQTVLSGMGELHLEIVEERLRRVYRVPCQLGQLQVAYREAPSLQSTASLQQALGPSQHSVVATVTLTPEEASGSSDVTFDPGVVAEGGEEELALRSAVESSLARGPLLGLPVQAVAVRVQELAGKEDTPLPVLCSCLAQAIHKALLGSEVRLLEPLAQLEVSVPEQFVGVVLSDLTSLRRAQVRAIAEGMAGQGEDLRVVTALVPLATLLGYASGLRSLTSGTASFSMVFSHHCPVDRHHQDTIIQQTRGY